MTKRGGDPHVLECEYVKHGDSLAVFAKNLDTHHWPTSVSNGWQL